MAGGLHALALWAQQQVVSGGGDNALPPATTGSYGAQLVQSVAALAGVCLAAWWALRWAARRGIGRALPGRHVHVVERVALDPRRSLYLVRVGSRTLLLGASEQALTTLAELAPDELATPTPEIAPPVPRFADVLARLRGAPAAPIAPPPPAATTAADASAAPGVLPREDDVL